MGAKPTSCVAALIASLSLLTGISPVCAEDGNQQAAQFNGELAVHRARSQLGYESHPRDEVQPLHVDYESLSQQIERLSRLIEDLQQSADSSSLLFRGVASGPLHRDRLFGARGPSVESVSALMRYRIAVSGNPNLQLGKVTNHQDHLSATVTTRDGSLVETYRIDKASGAITVAN